MVLTDVGGVEGILPFEGVVVGREAGREKQQ